ncbi:monooxygenase [Coemansia sp. RSA 1646]|nr:monooxygenase [Coemansia sp. RSA 1646]
MRLIANRIGVIGGGPAGLAVARVLASEPGTPFAVTVLERSNDVGGIWNYTPDPDVMQFPGVPFPKDAPDFPDRKQVQQYVHRYYNDPDNRLQGLVQLNSEVESVKYENSEWVCTVRRLSNDNRTDTLKFDALAICTGRVSHPYIPCVPGLEELAQENPGIVTHAKEYRRASDYIDMTVLVVGGASSGTDISRQLSFTARQVHLSVRSNENNDALEPTLGAGVNQSNRLRRHPQIQSITNDSVVFVDGSSIELPDRIIYATGYLSVYPFFQGNDQLEVLTDGRRINNLYKYLLYTQNPTLAIFGIPTKVVPFPLFEYQATFLAKVLRGIVKLPSHEEMQSQWDDLARQTSSHKQLYEFGMRQVEYQNELISIINNAYKNASDRERLRLGHVSEEWAQRRKHTFELRMKILGY